jgi:hypothetical protein
MRKVLFLYLLMICLAWQHAQGQWVQTNGPVRDTITCMVAMGTAFGGTTLFAGTAEHGVYSSLDNGVIWTQLNQGLPQLHVRQLAVIGDTVFAVLHDGVFRSSNGGATWEEASSGLLGGVYSVAVSADSDLFAGTEFGIFHSTDNGSSWMSINTPSSSPNWILLGVGRFNADTGHRTLFVQHPGDSIIWRSRDPGVNWEARVWEATVSAIAAIDTALIVSGDTSGTHLIARSTNDGVSWITTFSEQTGNFFQGLAVIGPDLFAGRSVGVCRSTDFGDTWVNISTGLRYQVSCLAVVGQSLFAGTVSGDVFVYADPSPRWFPAGVANHEVFALAANNFNIVAGSDSGIFRSTYPGTFWTAVGPAQIPVWSLAVSYPYQFAGTDDGVYRSTDGVNWTPAGLSSFRISAVFVKNSGGARLLFAGTIGSGVYVSTDDGQTWPLAKQGLKGFVINCFGEFGNGIFAGLKGHGVYCTADLGDSWQPENDGIETKSVNSLANYYEDLFAGTDSGGVYQAGVGWNLVSAGVPGMESIHALASSGTDLYAGTDNAGVFRTTNGGRTWAEISTGLPLPFGKRIFSLAVLSNIVYAGNFYGVYSFTLPVTGWVSSNVGVSCYDISAYTGETNPCAVFGDLCGGLYKSYDEGQTWAGAVVAPSAINTLSSVGGTSSSHKRALSRRSGNDTLIFLGGTEGSGIYRSADTAETWTASNAGLANLNVHSLTSYNDIVFAGTEDGVFRSSDYGLTWGAANAGMSGIAVLSLAAAGADIFAGTGGAGIFISSDGGGSWTSASTGLTNSTVLCLAVKSDSGGTKIFAGTDGEGIFLSTDNGASWGAVNSGLGDSTVRALVVAQGLAGEKDLYAGTDGGVFQSTDDGATWTGASTGMTNISVHALGVHGDNLFAGTYGGGVFKRPLPAVITSVEESGGELPEAFKLEQNFPNPFNPSTTIRFELPKSARVTLTIYNILGQTVRTLVDEDRPAGVHNVRFDAAGLASGVYFYRLMAGNFVQAKKLLILK